MSDNKRILFISRAYPPVLGGIENQNKAIHEILSKYFSVHAFINKHGKKALPIFLPWTIIRLLFSKRQHTTLLGDGVLAIIPWCLKSIKPNAKYICIVHGLDITYPSRVYQKLWINYFFLSVDHFIAVSHNTKELLIAKGIKENKIMVIPNGFDFSEINQNINRQKINALLQMETKNKTLIITLGRLVKRKGANWFTSNVLPKLPHDTLYIIAGDGPEKEAINQTIKRDNLSDRVKLLGKVSESEKEILLSNCDLYIQPNIIVENDVEGFGISVIEATAYNLPVITANLEGLKDAIENNKNGWLVEHSQANAYITKIQSVIKNKNKLKEAGISFKKYSQNKYDWTIIIYRYIDLIKKIQTRSPM